MSDTPRELELYRQEHGEPPVADEETSRQFNYRPRRGVSQFNFLQGDPGDEHDDGALVAGQERLL